MSISWFCFTYVSKRLLKVSDKKAKIKEFLETSSETSNIFALSGLNTLDNQEKKDINDIFLVGFFIISLEISKGVELDFLYNLILILFSASISIFNFCVFIIAKNKLKLFADN